MGGAEYTPRLQAIAPLHAAILAVGEDDRLKRTLGGVVVAVSGGRLLAHREWGRSGVADAAAPAGASLLWDRRFRVEIPRLGGALKVGALAHSGRRLGVQSGAQSAEKAAIRALPGLYQDGTLVAVPEAVRVSDDGLPLGSLAVECVVGKAFGIASPPRISLI